MLAEPLVSHIPTCYQDIQENHKSEFFQFNGDGNWSIEELDTGKLMTLNEEKNKLEAQLRSVSKIEDRLREVQNILGDSQQQEQDMVSESLSNMEADAMSSSSSPTSNEI